MSSMCSEVEKRIREHLQRRLGCCRPCGRHSMYREQQQELVELFTAAVDRGDSSSVLIVGPRGVGKTTLVEAALQQVQERPGFLDSAAIVCLSGLLHTDDRLALKSCTLQLGLENACSGRVFGSFAENLTFLLASLRTGQKHSSKSAIFVLDEFDMFCAHHNQTLLYNLLDISRSDQTPVLICGVTCRLDVVELLEKRVKSRFSHRQIFLFPRQNCESYIKHLLTLTPADSTFDDATRQWWNKCIQPLVKCSQWRRLEALDSSLQTIKNVLRMVLSQSIGSLLPALKAELQLHEADDHHVAYMMGLSVLELGLVVAMKHHSDIYDQQPFNFEMILTRYLQLAQRDSSAHMTQRDVVLKAFEHIQSLELILPVTPGARQQQKEYQLFRLAALPQQVQTAVQQFQGLPTDILQWANSCLA